MRRLLAALLIVSLVVAACMGGDGDDPDPTAGTASSAIPTATESAANETAPVVTTGTETSGGEM